jgi:hypothetical protein
MKHLQQIPTIDTRKLAGDLLPYIVENVGMSVQITYTPVYTTGDHRFYEHIIIHILPRPDVARNITDNLRYIMSYLDNLKIEYEVVNNHSMSEFPHIRIAQHRKFQ